MNRGGPEFIIQSDRLVIAGGHSERKEVLEPLGSAIDALGIFLDIDIVTINNLDGRRARSLLELMRRATVLGHSASLTRIDRALQIIAVNAPEQLNYADQFVRATRVMNDPVQREPGYPTGVTDLVKAGLQLVGSPFSTLRTMHAINNGFSTTQRLIDGGANFPAGRALVHSEHDSFGFAQAADLGAAATAGVTTLMLADHFHNEILLAPKKTVSLMTPAIFPELRL